ncbi:protelomerase family protein [Zooshikella sp. RANM57]|uniref:protelomerase family protein n=1 Tax=Zooshikella sp. RANM57 TaxID=3425863 RepID=UPI003D6F8675
MIITDGFDRTKHIVKTVQHIYEEGQKKGNKYITDRCGRVAKDEHKKLGWIVDQKSGELKVKPKISHNHYINLMNNYRRSIKALGYKHHLIDKTLKTFVDKYKGYRPEIADMLDYSLPLKTLRENIVILKSESRSKSDFRSDLLALRIEFHLYYLFEPKGIAVDKRKSQVKEALNEKHENVIKINGENIIKIAEKLLQNKSNYTDIAIGLALLTGRRANEIMKTAKCRVASDKTLFFDGQLKTHNRYLFETLGEYEIPCLTKPELVIKALKRLRKMTGEEMLVYTDVDGSTVRKKVKDSDKNDLKHNDAVNRRFTASLNQRTKAILGHGQFSFRTCRSIYVELAFHEFRKDKESKAAFRSRVLGHSGGDKSTQNHYEGWELDNTIETIDLISADHESKKQQFDKKLLDHLEQYDDVIANYRRAPNWKKIHEWLKSQVKQGVEVGHITVSYIRKMCIIDNKNLNANTIQKYIETIELNEYKK